MRAEADLFPPNLSASIATQSPTIDESRETRGRGNISTRPSLHSTCAMDQSPEIVDWGLYQAYNQPATNSEARLARNLELMHEGISTLDRTVNLWFDHFERRMDAFEQTMDVMSRRVLALNRKMNKLDDKVTEVDTKVLNLDIKIDELVDDLMDGSGSEDGDSSHTGTVGLGGNMTVSGQISLTPVFSPRADE